MLWQTCLLITFFIDIDDVENDFSFFVPLHYIYSTLGIFRKLCYENVTFFITTEYGYTQDTQVIKAIGYLSLSHIHLSGLNLNLSLNVNN